MTDFRSPPYGSMFSRRSKHWDSIAFRSTSTGPWSRESQAITEPRVFLPSSPSLKQLRKQVSTCLLVPDPISMPKSQAVVFPVGCKGSTVHSGRQIKVFWTPLKSMKTISFYYTYWHTNNAGQLHRQCWCYHSQSTNHKWRTGDPLPARE